MFKTWNQLIVFWLFCFFTPFTTIVGFRTFQRAAMDNSSLIQVQNVEQH